MSQCASATITVVPTSGGLGAEIRGIDLSREMDAYTFSQVYEAWLQYSVLLFRGQHLTDDDLITFSRNFGELDWAPVQVLNNPHLHPHPLTIVGDWTTICGRQTRNIHCFQCDRKRHTHRKSWGGRVGLAHRYVLFRGT